MDFLNSALDSLRSIIPMSIAIALSVLVIFAVKGFLEKKYAAVPDRRFGFQLILLLLSIVGVLIVIIVSPLSDSEKGQLLGLIGILLSAAIALSSTTFLGNIMAGMMLRIIRSFRPGDFIRVGEYFGRVSERGIFHIEIQTEDRDLMTLPNLYLVTHPVKVILSSGTFITAEVSLGYDVPHDKICELLIEAARESELVEPFVRIMHLGDFSVTYRIAGMLSEVKHILSARSKLREKMLDKFHQAKIEIVSPTFMNTRAISADKEFIPNKVREKKSEIKKAPVDVPETLLFDKAEEADSIEKLRERSDLLAKESEQLKSDIKKCEDEAEKEKLRERQRLLEERRERLMEYIKKRETEKQD